MTVDPRLQLTPGEYLIHPDGSASRVVGKRNMTVDEILATGQYTDRRGREWKRGPSFVCNRDWFYLTGISRGGYANDAEMRLLIERDQHRDECVGIAECDAHPVMTVIWHRTFGHWLVFNESSFFPTGAPHDSLGEALSAARALAVGE